MTQLDFDRFAAMIATFSEIRNRPLSAGTIEVYFRVLSQWTIEEIERAGKDIIQHVDFFPAPSDFVKRLETDVKVSEDELALLTWTIVLGIRDGADQYATYEFLDVAAGAAFKAAFQGVPEFFDMPFEKLDYQKRDFMSLYKIFRRRGASGTVTLPGLIERGGGTEKQGVKYIRGAETKPRPQLMDAT